jgi:DNA excision repair protein ERCC-2
MAVIKMAVRELVDFTLRSGDIKPTFLSSKRAVDGTKAHTRYQKKMIKLYGDDYVPEVSFSHEYQDGEDIVLISGRMDGVDFSEDICIDEIKSTHADLADISEPSEMHLAQVKLYAYFYAAEHGLDEIDYKVIYIELEKHKDKSFAYHADIDSLEAFFVDVMERYMSFYRKVLAYERKAKESIESTVFPFGDFRVGQKTLMKRVYETIEGRETLFARAPTGIGKTIGTLYPALKTFGRDKTDKIFYLTAKTIGKKVAIDTLKILKEHGLDVKFLLITAKEKCCTNETFACNPDECSFANGHYDRVNDAIVDLYDHEDCFTADVIEEYAIKHQVCPYEFTLDMALFSSVIVCDYNYAFDPQAMLKRFFSEGTGRYSLLIDEAHNLIDRGRSMYSAEFSKSRVLEIRRLIKPIDNRLYNYMGKINTFLLDKRKTLDDTIKGTVVEDEEPIDMSHLIKNVQGRIEKIFAKHQKWEGMPDLLDFYFECIAFNKILELYGPHYVTYYEKQKSDLRVKLFCLNPGVNIQNTLKMVYGTTFFSATLSPMSYYQGLLCQDEEAKSLTLGSPFPLENLNLLINDRISTKYVDRPESIEPIIESIHGMIKEKLGHYIVYFPSYRYMMDVLEAYEPVVDELLVIQRPGQTEQEKEMFVEAFHDVTDQTKIGFAVMGGMFGEGIDLTGDKLSGVIIVGVGLPMICFERDIIKNYFAEENHMGFEYAYVYPGMNKVMQSAGRVIRTMKDKGVVLLIDTRFRRRDYQSLYPYEWRHRKFVGSTLEMTGDIAEFWDGIE